MHLHHQILAISYCVVCINSTQLALPQINNVFSVFFIISHYVRQSNTFLFCIKIYSTEGFCTPCWPASLLDYKLPRIQQALKPERNDDVCFIRQFSCNLYSSLHIIAKTCINSVLEGPSIHFS